MNPIIEKERNKPKVLLARQYKENLNKDGPALFYPPKNYYTIPILRPKDLILSEEQQNYFDGDVREGTVPFCQLLTDNLEAWSNLSKGSFVLGLLKVVGKRTQIPYGIKTQKR
ncbi:MAG: hypothetical protein EZS28_027056 [Streblomastix strix]|uniref:Uncharacterized protein n=1 Tax=Streblomastix strix TaxID=222440 RepID=A0A5J4V497_9EUKA|nr:MAG: hypothetical protein EZS28_027056 [Streblomastix strix]